MINKKLKVFIMVLVTLIIASFIIIVGLYMGGFRFDKIEGSIDSMSTKCLESSLKDGGSVSLDKVVPISDEDGKKTTPYTYKIKNNCKRDVEYFVTLNVMEGSNMDNLSKIKINLNGSSIIEPKYVGTLEEVQLTGDGSKGVIKAYKLDDGLVKPGEEKSFELRQWIDYGVTKIEGSIITKISVKQFEN